MQVEVSGIKEVQRGQCRAGVAVPQSVGSQASPARGPYPRLALALHHSPQAPCGERDIEGTVPTAPLRALPALVPASLACAMLVRLAVLLPQRNSVVTEEGEKDRIFSLPTFAVFLENRLGVSAHLYAEFRFF